MRCSHIRSHQSCKSPSSAWLWDGKPWTKQLFHPTLLHFLFSIRTFPKISENNSSPSPYPTWGVVFQGKVYLRGTRYSPSPCAQRWYNWSAASPVTPRPVTAVWQMTMLRRWASHLKREKKILLHEHKENLMAQQTVNYTSHIITLNLGYILYPDLFGFLNIEHVEFSLWILI